MNGMIFNNRSNKVFLILIGLLMNMQNSHANDDYLQGYLSAILEQQLGWQSECYRIKVVDSFATLTIKDNSCENNDQLIQLFSQLPMLVDFKILTQSEPGAEKIPSYTHYPRGDYFRPVVADVKEPQFFISFLQAKDDNESTLIGSVGLGETFGLYRWPSSAAGDGWQLSYFAAIFSQFNMDASSDDLLNSDYLVGFPLSFRYGNFSGRFRLFHQSSHLGDELLLSGQAPARVNLSIEAVDMLLAYDIGYWRAMIGGTRILSHDPSDIEERALSSGIDYRNPEPAIGNSRFIAGIYSRWLEDVDWNSGTSAKFGLEFGQNYPGSHGTRLMFEAYKGLIPFGQFYTSDTEYYGLGFYIDFN